MRGAAVVLIIVGAVAPAACKRDDAADLLPPPGYVEPPFHPLAGPVPPGGSVRFGEGFYGLEASPEGRTWRWMGKRGTVRLPLDGHAKELRLAGHAPIELLKQVPTLRVTLGGRELARVVSDFVGGRYTMPPAELGSGPSAELVIETSETVHAPGDPRELGVSIDRLDWRDASDGPAAPSLRPAQARQ